MSANILRGGIIGVGKMGLAHAAILNTMNNVQLVAVCEPTKLIGSAFKKFLPKIKLYDDYELMLKNENLNFTFITTPPHLHIEMAIECVKHGIPFFIEKPLSINAKSCVPLINKIKNVKIKNMVGYMMRYDKTFMLAKKIIKDEVLGKIITFNGTMYVSQLFTKGKGWRYDKEKSGGGVIIAQTTHLIDLITWYFGTPNHLNANTLAHYSEQTEDFVHSSFKWNDGLSGWIDSSWSVFNHRLLETTIKIHGENGNMLVSDDTVKLFLTKDSGKYSKGWTIITKPELEDGVIMDIGGTSYSRQDEDFINKLKNNQQIETDVVNAYNNLLIIEGIYESAKNGGSLINLEP